jgi:two-component system OmpR family response regulator
MSKGVATAVRTRVLVVEDDEETRELVQEALAAAGHQVEAVGLASQADAAARAGGVDAVVLDVWLPDGDGTEVCRAWRQSGLGMPILMLTARTDVGSRVSGLDAGADDYLGKPFAMAELRARIAALLRRGSRPVGRVPYRRGGTRIDFARRQAWNQGREVPITRRELAILERLAHEPGQVVPRQALLEAVWGESTAEAAASLEVLVGRIRNKLDPEGLGLIRTHRGVGYAIADLDVDPGSGEP